MITAVSRGDLEQAMVNPSKYTNLIVRVGGFSARFIELRKEIQLDLLHRTLHE
ncbi:MAG: glycine radical domain-containing protein [Clostridia bacterium]